MRAAGQSGAGPRRYKGREETEQVPAGVGKSVNLGLQASLCLFLLEERLQLALFKAGEKRGQLAGSEEEEEKGARREDVRELLRQTVRDPGERLAGQTSWIDSICSWFEVERGEESNRVSLSLSRSTCPRNSLEGESS